MFAHIKLHRVIFRLKRLWKFDPENQPKGDAICARCGHTFSKHLSRADSHSCCGKVKVESIRRTSFFKRCGCEHFMVDLYEEIKNLRKPSEWRDASEYWLGILFRREIENVLRSKSITDKPIDVTEYLKVKEAWFLVGFPKDNLPRLETNIPRALYHPLSDQFEIKVADVIEILRD